MILLIIIPAVNYWEKYNNIEFITYINKTERPICEVS